MCLCSRCTELFFSGWRIILHRGGEFIIAVFTLVQVSFGHFHVFQHWKTCAVDMLALYQGSYAGLESTEMYGMWFRLFPGLESMGGKDVAILAIPNLYFKVNFQNGYFLNKSVTCKHSLLYSTCVKLCNLWNKSPGIRSIPDPPNFL